MSNAENREVGEQLVGKIILAQLGNSFDSHWCPEAEALVLDSETNFGSIQYTAVSKKQDGQLLILFHLTLKEDETGYCTKACELKSPHFVAMAGGVDAAVKIEAAVAKHMGTIEGNLYAFQWTQRVKAA